MATSLHQINVYLLSEGRALVHLPGRRDSNQSHNDGDVRLLNRRGCMLGISGCRGYVKFMSDQHLLTIKCLVSQALATEEDEKLLQELMEFMSSEQLRLVVDEYEQIGKLDKFVSLVAHGIVLQTFIELACSEKNGRLLNVIRQCRSLFGEEWQNDLNKMLSGNNSSLQEIKVYLMAFGTRAFVHPPRRRDSNQRHSDGDVRLRNGRGCMLGISGCRGYVVRFMADQHLTIKCLVSQALATEEDEKVLQELMEFMSNEQLRLVVDEYKTTSTLDKFVSLVAHGIVLPNLIELACSEKHRSLLLQEIMMNGSGSTQARTTQDVLTI